MVGRVVRGLSVLIYKIFNPNLRNAKLYAIPRVYFKKCLVIGKNVHINDNVFINAVGNVSVGDNSVLSHGVAIISTGLKTDNWKERVGLPECHEEKMISIGENVWLCANVLVCQGVTIANNCIVAGGAVVINNLAEENCLYGGIPAKKIKEI